MDHVTRNEVKEMWVEAVVAYVCTYELRICQRTSLCVDKRSVGPEWPVALSSFTNHTTRIWIRCANFYTFILGVSTRLTHALYPKCKDRCIIDQYVEPFKFSSIGQCVPSSTLVFRCVVQRKTEIRQYAFLSRTNSRLLRPLRASSSTTDCTQPPSEENMQRCQRDT
jgi:hypothetical protein